MDRKRHGIAVVAAGIAVALALAGAAVAALRGHAAARATVVKVTEREYHIALSKSSLAAGTVTFTIHNAGKLAHGFSVSGAGLRTMSVKTIKPGATRALTVKLAGGTLRVWCPVPGHAALGMKASLTVKGSPAGAGTGGTTTSGGGAWG